MLEDYETKGLEVETETLPKKGNFRLECIKSSQYFFS